MQVRCYKSEIHEGHCDIEIDGTTVLSKVRELLKAKHFLENTSLKNDFYRFVNKGELEGEFAYSDVIIGLGVERFIQCSQIMNQDNNILVLTDTARDKNTDFIGFKTDWWSEGYVKVKCYLNKSNENAKKSNANIPFEPVMLNNVISTNPNLTLPFSNVCICCEGSVVGFNVNSWGAAGFVLQIGSDVGEKIIDWGMRGTGNNPGTYQTVSVSGWQDGTRNIEIAALDNLQDLMPGVSIRYQKVTFKTSRITNYKNSEGTVYHSDLLPPEVALKRANPLCAARTLESFYTPNDSKKPGAPVAGKPSGTKYTGRVSDVKWDGWEKLLGKIDVYFFVFNSLKDAETVIKILNFTT